MSALRPLVSLRSSSAVLLYALTLAGCGRPVTERESAKAEQTPVTNRALVFDASASEPRAPIADAKPAAALLDEQPATAQAPPEEAPAQVEAAASEAPTSTSPVATESRLDRARRVIETEGLIAKAIHEISQTKPTEKVAELLEDIAAKERIYQLLAADIANDAENLVTAGLIMPWELRTRDVERNLALGRSPFRRPVSSGSLGLAQRIGNEQLESVRQVIDQSKRALLNSRMRRAWATLTPEQQVQCDKYQPEFAAEASGRNEAELARLASEIQRASQPDLLVARGRLLAARGSFQEALNDLTRALSGPIDDEDSVRLLRAEIALELGDTTAALRDYQHVAGKQGPLSDRAYVAWGKLLAQRAPADAMSKAEEALKVNANCAAAHALLADIYKSMNQRILTIEALQTAARLAPDDPTHFYRLGNLQAGLGATDEAIQAYTQAVAADPTWWRPYAGRATLRYRQRDPQAALADLHEASAWAPREPSIYENRAVVLQALGRSEEAERDRASAKTLATGGVL